VSVHVGVKTTEVICTCKSDAKHGVECMEVLVSISCLWLCTESLDFTSPKLVWTHALQSSSRDCYVKWEKSNCQLELSACLKFEVCTDQVRQNMGAAEEAHTHTHTRAGISWKFRNSFVPISDCARVPFLCFYALNAMTHNRQHLLPLVTCCKTLIDPMG